MEYRVSNGQSTIDVTLQLVGDFNTLLDFIEGNGIESVDTLFEGGEIVNYEQPENAEGLNNLEKGYIFNTSDPIIQGFGDYNDDYNDDYL